MSKVTAKIELGIEDVEFFMINIEEIKDSLLSYCSINEFKVEIPSKTVIDVNK